jgi:sulfide dehydrogenase [flavocytochrome c] flavoprotein chain
MTELSRRAFLGAAGFVITSLSMPRIAYAYQRERYLVVGAGLKGVQVALDAQAQNHKRDVILLDQGFASIPATASPLAPKTVHPDMIARFEALGGKLVTANVAGIDYRSGYLLDKTGARHNFDQVETHLGYAFKKTDMPGIKAVLQGRILHAWQDHHQADQLWQQVQTMKQGGVVVIAIPETEYRFNQGPFVRGEIIASYLEQFNPHAKIIILDGHERTQEITFNSPMIEWVSKDQNGKVIAISPDGRALITKDARVQGDVINFIPDQVKIDL